MEKGVNDRNDNKNNNNNKEKQTECLDYTSPVGMDEGFIDKNDDKN